MYYQTRYDQTIKLPTSFKLTKVVSIIFVIGSVISMILYPKYNINEKYLSDLGTNRQSAFLFNTTIMLTAILLIPVFFGIYRYLNTYISDTAQFLLCAGLLTGITSAIFLFLVGIYPASPPTLQKHELVAMIFFILLALTFWFLTLVLFSAQNSHSELSTRRIEDYLGFVFVPLVLLFGDMTTWYNVILQKVIVYLSMFYLMYFINRIYEVRLDKTFYYHKEKFRKEEAFTLYQVVANSRILF